MFYPEQAAAEKLGLNKETLRHWRVGYTVTSKGKRYTYPPKMKDGEGTTWKKEYPTKFSPILWDADFVDTLASALHTQRIAMGDLNNDTAKTVLRDTNLAVLGGHCGSHLGRHTLTCPYGGRPWMGFVLCTRSGYGRRVQRRTVAWRVY